MTSPIVPTPDTVNISLPEPPTKLVKLLKLITSSGNGLLSTVNTPALMLLTSQSFFVPPVKVLPVPSMLRFSILLKSLTAIL